MLWLSHSLILLRIKLKDENATKLLRALKLYKNVLLKRGTVSQVTTAVMNGVWKDITGCKKLRKLKYSQGE